MKTVTTLIMSTALVAAIGLGAATPAAAQGHDDFTFRGPNGVFQFRLNPGGGEMTMPFGFQHPNGPRGGMGEMGDMGDMGHMFDGLRDMIAGHIGGGGAALINFICTDRGAEALEIGLVRLSYRLDLTDEQRPLYEDLRTAVLTAQTSFSDSCADRPESFANPVERLTHRQAVLQAEIDAISSVLPPLEALWASLTDEQKANIGPRQPRAGGENAGAETPATPSMMPMPETPADPGRVERPEDPGRIVINRPERPPAPGR